MKYYTTTTEFNCGIDLHTRQMYVCIMDREGKVLVHRNIRNNDFDFFLKLAEPYRHALTVTCESSFTCFWLADACEDAGIKFVLAHAYYVRSIAANKHKNDKEDSRELAECLRTNRIPPAYVCPRDLRPVRKLLRRRNKYVKNRAELTGHSTCEVMAAGHEPLATSANSKARWQEGIRASFEHPVDAFTAEAELAIIASYDRVIMDMEQRIEQHARDYKQQDYRLLRTAPGIGKILALTILYETIDIKRFPSVKDFISYSRLATGTNESGGKDYGGKGRKMGNPYLKWAFMQAAILCKRADPKLNAFSLRLEQKKGKYTANAIVAAKIARAVYFMLAHKTGFSVEQLVRAKIR
jgi:transposase